MNIMDVIYWILSWGGVAAIWFAAIAARRTERERRKMMARQYQLVLEDIVKATRLRRAFREEVGLPPDDEPVTNEEIERVLRSML
jgi:hypothetical protein